RGRSVCLGAERGLGSDRDAERLSRAAPAHQRHLRHPGVPGLPEVDLTHPSDKETVMFIPLTAALSWPQASVYIAAIAAGGVVVAVLVGWFSRPGQAAIRSERRESDGKSVGCSPSGARSRASRPPHGVPPGAAIRAAPAATSRLASASLSSTSSASRTG